MAYETLYRRFRPQDFDSLVGQEPVKTALKNAIESGRISHAYLFSGPRGTGKTSTARILAKALCCDEGPTAHPCGRCGNCERITLGTSMDVFEIDAASNRGIEEIQTLREQLAFAPVASRYKIYIIDEVHMMTDPAFNALLKTLEEPPAHVIFILATTDAHKIPATIHSRCQRFDFRRVTISEITEHLKKVAKEAGITAEDEALRLMAIQADGGLRDALSLLEQCSVVDKKVTAAGVRETLGIVGREVVREIVKNIGGKNLAASLTELSKLFEQGKDARQILSEIAEYMRAVLLYKTAPKFEETYLTDTEENLATVAPLFTPADIMAAQEKIHASINELKGAMRSRITTELCFFELCREEGSVAALTERIEALERRLAAQPEKGSVQVFAEKSVQPAPKEAVKSAAKAAAAKPAAKEEIKPAAKPAAKEEKPAVQAEVKPAAKPAAKAKNTAAAEVPETGDGRTLWQAALDILKEEKKHSMVSCAKNGTVREFKDGVLTVEFTVKFQCDRMNKNDYREAFENAILRTCRKKVRLNCVAVAGKKVPEEEKIPENENLKPVKKLPEELPERLKSVMDAFGETVETIEEG